MSSLLPITHLGVELLGHRHLCVPPSEEPTIFKAGLYPHDTGSISGPHFLHIPTNARHRLGFILVTPTGVKWCLTTVCISLMTREHLSCAYWPLVHILWTNVYSNTGPFYKYLFWTHIPLDTGFANIFSNSRFVFCFTFLMMSLEAQKSFTVRQSNLLRSSLAACFGVRS